MITVPEIIDRLGGPTKFGRLCGFTVNPGARGHDMKMRRSIPLRYWTPILAEAAKKAPEITLSVLKANHPNVTLPELPSPARIPSAAPSTLPQPSTARAWHD